MQWALFLAVGIAGSLALFVVVTYNKLVTLRVRIAESWSNVDTELKRRHDLVPNLVEAVRGAAAHERGLLDELVRLRAAAMGAGETRRDAEAGLARALGRVVALAEAYPTLRASESFLALQRELVVTEDRIQAARRFHNGNVRDLNDLVGQFPTNLVAQRFGFRPAPYFELPEAAQRIAPDARP